MNAVTYIDPYRSGYFYNTQLVIRRVGMSSRSAEKPANAPVTSLVANHVHRTKTSYGVFTIQQHGQGKPVLFLFLYLSFYLNLCCAPWCDHVRIKIIINNRILHSVSSYCNIISTKFHVDVIKSKRLQNESQNNCKYRPRIWKK